LPSAHIGQNGNDPYVGGLLEVKISYDDLVGRVGNILLSRDPDKPWMTATGLSRRLKDEHGFSIDPMEVELILEEHSRKPGREIRYSYYPSKRTLDILWGHVDMVGEQKYLPALERLDEPAEDSSSRVAENAPWFFISHNHRDLKLVIELRNQLVEGGYGVWIYETEIPLGDRIPASVREAIQDCEYFVTYVSARSLGSLWVQKEIEAALGGTRNLCIVLDGEDERLLNLLKNWADTGPPDAGLVVEFCRVSASSIGKANDHSWINRCREFVEKFEEYLDRTNRVVIVFPSPRNRDLWQSEDLRIDSLDEFLGKMSE
jgi:TIR domain